MADAAFKTAPFPGMTIGQLRDAVLRKRDDRMETEIARREAVAHGDVSAMTPGERLRYARSHPEWRA